MSLFDDASLVLTPNGVKSGKVYSIKPTDGVGDFDFTRASLATRVNSDGLIEEVSIEVPRLDYPPLGSCPSLLLEPQRTNLMGYSEQFDNAAWTKINVTVVSNNIISPNGTLNASRLTDNATSGLHTLRQSNNFVSGQTYTASIFAKKGTASRVWIGSQSIFTYGVESFFDLDNGTVSLQSLGNASIEDYGNGWYRCKVAGGVNFSQSTSVFFGLSNSANNKTYIGSDNYAYFWGAQLEIGANATSYIPTVASTVTRNADVTSITGLTGITTITETFENETTNVISGSPTSYTVSQGRIKQVIGI